MYGNNEGIRTNPRYKLRSMIRGESNHDAYKAAFEVICGNKDYNPLMIYGDKGLGKTFLLHAIANETFYEGVWCDACYETSDEIIDEIRNEKYKDLLVDKYLKCDLLLLDDFHKIPHDDGICDTLMDIIAKRKDEGKHTVIASRRKPVAIYGIGKNLRWCLESGRVVKIEYPGSDERFLMLKVIRHNRNLVDVIDDEILEIIAEKTEGKNMDELEGFLNKYLNRTDHGYYGDYSYKNDLCDKLDCMNSIIKDEYETCHNRFIENIDNMDSQTIKYRKWQSNDKDMQNDTDFADC